MALVKLYAYPRVFGVASASPYSLKVIYALRYLEIPFEVETVGPRKPGFVSRKRVPAAHINGELVEDSTNILKAIDKLHPGPSRLYPEAPALLADTTLLEDWSDESLTMYLGYYRFMKDENFRRFMERALSKVPPLMRGFVAKSFRRRFQKRFALHAISVLPEEERRERFAEHMHMLALKLEPRDFLCGPRPTAADFAVYGTLDNIISGRIPELCPLILREKPLQAWLERMEGLVKFEAREKR